MKHQDVVIHARTYDFKNDEGKLVKGGEIHILSRKHSNSNEEGVSNGHKIAQVEVPFKVAQEIMGKVPAVCDIEYEITVINNALVLLPRNIQVIKELDSLNILDEKYKLKEDQISAF
nr:hypothetical protein [Neobacillus sp. Marseille-Q6967]